MKKRKLRRCSLSEARVWHKMDGDPCPCPTSLEDLQPADRESYIRHADGDTLSRWAVSLARCYREINSVGLLRRKIGAKEFISLTTRAVNWESIAHMERGPQQEETLRQLVTDICQELPPTALQFGICTRMEMHPDVPGWEARLWLASHHGEYNVATAALHLGCDDHNIHQYLESIGLGPNTVKRMTK